MFRRVTLNSRAAAVTSTTRRITASRGACPLKVVGHRIDQRQHPQRGGCREAATTAAAPNNKPRWPESETSTVSWPNTSSGSATHNDSNIDSKFSQGVKRRIPSAVRRKGNGDVVATVCGLSRVTGVSEAVGDSDSKRWRRNFEMDGNTGCFVPEPTPSLSIKVCEAELTWTTSSQSMSCMSVVQYSAVFGTQIRDFRTFIPGVWVGGHP